MYSEEHFAFLKQRKTYKKNVIIFRFIILFILIITWELLARFKFIDVFLSSSPYCILRTFAHLLKDGMLINHLKVTFFEVLICFFLSNVIGLSIAILLWRFEFIAKVIDPYITILNSLPKVALGPLIIIWIGASMSSIIFMSLLISVFITIINIYNGFISTEKNYFILLKSFGASKFKIFRYVVFPYNYINIISTLKINISMSLIGVIMGELLVSKAGLGYLIMYGSQVFNINLIITSIVILAFVSYFMYFIIEKLESCLLKKR